MQRHNLLKTAQISIFHPAVLVLHHKPSPPSQDETWRLRWWISILRCRRLFLFSSSSPQSRLRHFNCILIADHDARERVNFMLNKTSWTLSNDDRLFPDADTEILCRLWDFLLFRLLSLFYPSKSQKAALNPAVIKNQAKASACSQGRTRLDSDVLYRRFNPVCLHAVTLKMLH